MPTPRNWLDADTMYSDDEYSESTRLARLSDAMAVFDEMTADIEEYEYDEVDA